MKYVDAGAVDSEDIARIAASMGAEPEYVRRILDTMEIEVRS
jgi:hypothetical protein